MKIANVLPAMLLAVLVTGGIAASDGDWLEPNMDRPGNDYRDFDLPGDSTAPDAGLKQCMITCEQEDRCVAFTHVKAGVQGPNPRCWLKDAVPAQVASDCCTSWVKNGASGVSSRGPAIGTPVPGGPVIGTPVPGGPAIGTPGPGNRVNLSGARPASSFAPMLPLQYGINLHGSDYRDFEMAANATPEMCQEACKSEGQCRAFTFVRAGEQGATPHCWLKNTVPQAYSDARCVSGVKRPGG